MPMSLLSDECAARVRAQVAIAASVATRSIVIADSLVNASHRKGDDREFEVLAAECIVNLRKIEQFNLREAGTSLQQDGSLPSWPAGQEYHVRSNVVLDERRIVAECGKLGDEVAVHSTTLAAGVIPQQPNWYDCGCYAIVFIRCVAAHLVQGLDLDPDGPLPTVPAAGDDESKRLAVRVGIASELRAAWVEMRATWLDLQM